MKLFAKIEFHWTGGDYEEVCLIPYVSSVKTSADDEHTFEFEEGQTIDLSSYSIPEIN